MTLSRNAATRLARRQRGVVLFVALIAMVVLSLAGIALMRSVDTTMGVAGNIAFRQATIGPVNEAMEEAVNVIYKAKTLASPNANDLTQNYYASIQPGESRSGVPAALRGSYSAMVATYTGAGLAALYSDPVSGAEVRWVIERVCNSAAATPEQITGHCDTLPPKVASAGTDNEVGIPLPPIPLYRVTVRADIPNTNAVSYAQTFLR
jgi:Tfp pilus assembly protein PilX